MAAVENTLTCPECDGYDVELTNDNGAKYPNTRVECYLCHHCEHSFGKVLTA